MFDDITCRIIAARRRVKYQQAILSLKTFVDSFCKEFFTLLYIGVGRQVSTLFHLKFQVFFRVSETTHSLRVSYSTRLVFNGNKGTRKIPI